MCHCQYKMAKNKHFFSIITLRLVYTIYNIFEFAI